MTAPPGLIVDPTVPEQAMTDTLKRWLPTYLAHLARLKGRDPESIETPQSWNTVNEPLDKWPEDQVPAMYVVSMGITTPPELNGEGVYRADFDLGVAAVVEDVTRQDTDDLVKLYVAAIWGAVTQNRSLGGVAAGTAWLGGTWDLVPNNMKRTLAGCEARFVVTIDNVVDVFDGLSEPEPGTPPIAADERPTFQTADAAVDQREEQS
jgi:hypothetical protein